jgi:SPP1 family predicted phage head-tail adaptor
MRAGTLRHIIKIEKRKDVTDAVGQMVPTWSTLRANVPAAYEPARGREFFAAQGQIVEEPALFRIRYSADVVATMRVQFRGKVWDIASVEDVGGREREMHLYCATGLTEG